MSTKTKTIKTSTIQTVRDDINPQLCKTYNASKHDWSHPWWAEPKLDGLRCCTVVDPRAQVAAYSRNGKPLWNLFNILVEIADCNKRTEELRDGFVLDGELYTKDWNLSMSITKRSTKPHPDQDKLHYHMWDCLTLKEWKAGKSIVPNDVRKQRLSPWEDCTSVGVVFSVTVNNDKELQDAYQKCLAHGYEGVVLKDPKGIYECGRRSPYWLKVKPWSDADLTVVGSYAGKGKHLGRIGGLIVEGEATWNGNTYHVRTEVGTGFSDEERQTFQGMVDDNSLLGKTIEIKFQDITVDGSCRFPVYSRLRSDK